MNHNYICVRCRRRTTNTLGCYNPGCGGVAFVYSPTTSPPVTELQLRMRLPLHIHSVPLGALARLNQRLIK